MIYLAWIAVIVPSLVAIALIVALCMAFPDEAAFFGILAFFIAIIFSFVWGITYIQEHKKPTLPPVTVNFQAAEKEYK